MTAQIINFPTRPLPDSFELFCQLPSNIEDIAAMDDCIVAICEDGAYLIDANGEYEKIERPK